MLKPLPVGIQTFSDLIEGGFLYVDKTRWIYELVRYPKGVYFLSRPRRFGKSLLVSTLEAIFQGRRELFQGLWIEGSDYDWEEHPVLHIDFSMLQVEDAEELKQKLAEQMEELAAEHGVSLPAGDYQKHLRDLIRQLASRNRVAVLIDEYDKPIIDNIENVQEAEQIRKVLKGFYTILKGMDRYLRFVLLTGVSKFSKAGVFSGLNNLRDITNSTSYSSMLGITEEELRRDFEGYITTLAEKERLSRDELLEQINDWYDGFCFSVDCQSVYNPFSLLLLFQEHQFVNHWFETGTPTFLIELLREQSYALQELEGLQVNELAFSSYEVEDLSPLPLLVQTGYLTIKSYNRERRLYTLGYPNREVEDAFVKYLVDEFSGVRKETAETYVWQLIDALRAGDFEQFFEVLHVFFAGIPYDIQIRRERYYQSIFYLIFKLMSLQVQAEVRTSRGRIDVVVELAEGVFIFEFKLEEAGDAQAALAQIKERGYAEPYRMMEKPVHLIGAVFGTGEGGVIDWTAESMIGDGE